MWISVYIKIKNFITISIGINDVKQYYIKKFYLQFVKLLFVHRKLQQKNRTKNFYFFNPVYI